MTETVTAHGRHWIVRVNGTGFHHWTTCEVGLDLANLAGIFRIEIAADVPIRADAALLPNIHDEVEVEIEGTVVLRGNVEAVNGSGDAHALHLTISGRDRSGDLVDCTANPCGPAEYRQIRLETVVGHLTSPFGVTVSQDVATGAPFTLVALEPSDTVLGAIERLSRQRGILVTSDGLGGLRLTQAGQTRAQDTLVYPRGNVEKVEFRRMQRHSDTWVKGQFKSHLRGNKAPLNTATVPGSVQPKAGATAKERAASARYGHAVDPGVPRYRPIAHLAKTQSGASVATQNTGNPPIDGAAQGQPQPVPAQGAYRGRRAHRRKKTPSRQAADPWTLQDQALWRMRTARAHATAYVYTVPGVLNAAGDLWRPNELVTVQDLLNGIFGDMLIAAVTWVHGHDRVETRISVVPPDAYDLSGEADAPAHHGRRTTMSGRVWAGKTGASGRE